MTDYILNSSKLISNPVIANTGLVLRQTKKKYETNGKSTNQLSFLNAHKMVEKLLTCDRIVTKEAVGKKFTKEELAKKLCITVSELETLAKPLPSKMFYRKTAGDIALPLVKLYCNTKWAENKIKTIA